MRRLSADGRQRGSGSTLGATALAFSISATTSADAVYFFICGSGTAAVSDSSAGEASRQLPARASCQVWVLRERCGVLGVRADLLLEFFS